MINKHKHFNTSIKDKWKFICFYFCCISFFLWSFYFFCVNSIYLMCSEKSDFNLEIEELGVKFDQWMKFSENYNLATVYGLRTKFPKSLLIAKYFIFASVAFNIFCSLGLVVMILKTLSNMSCSKENFQ